MAALSVSVLSVLQALLALGAELLNAVLHLVEAVVAFGTDLFGCLVGFVTGRMLLRRLALHG